MSNQKKIDAKEFWEEKIIGWETGRYSFSKNNKSSILEKIANKSSNSLRRRLFLAGKLLAPFVEGKNVLELGCGSGLLTPAIMSSGAKSYLGLDIAPVALQEARKRHKDAKWIKKVKYQAGGVGDVKGSDYDIVISLGLTDWLTDEELDKIFSLSPKGEFFHSFSENRNSLSQFIHKLYVNISYGYKTGGYKPRYFSETEMTGYSKKFGHSGYFFRDRALKFGVFFSSLPIAVDCNRN